MLQFVAPFRELGHDVFSLVIRDHENRALL